MNAGCEPRLAINRERERQGDVRDAGKNKEQRRMEKEGKRRRRKKESVGPKAFHPSFDDD